MAESFLTQAEKISALEDSLTESQVIVLALLRAVGGSITVRNEYLEDMSGYDLTCTDDLIREAKVFGVRRADPGAWSPYTESACRHLNNLRGVRGPGGWRNIGGRDHEHWVPTELDASGEVCWSKCSEGHTYSTGCAQQVMAEIDANNGSSGPTPPAQQSEILPLSDQDQLAEFVLPRIRSLALPDGRFAFVVSGWESKGDEEHAAFVASFAEFASQCGAVATGVFEEHIEVG